MRCLDHGLNNGPSFLSDALKLPSQAAVYQILAVDDPVEVHFEGDNLRSGPNVMWLWPTGNRMDPSLFLRKRCCIFWGQKRLGKWDCPNEEYDTSVSE